MARLKYKQQNAKRQGGSMTEKNACSVTERAKDDCRCGIDGKNCVNSRFTLAIVAVILSCLGGFWTIPLALAALILALRAQDLAHDNHLEEARRAAWWVGLFGWVTIGVALLPIIAILFFGSTIMAILTAILASA